MKDSAFLAAISDVTRTLGFPVLLYNNEAERMLSVYKGEATDTEVPDGIMPYLNDKKSSCTYFSRSDSLLVIYFIRMKIHKSSYVLMMQDNKQRTRLNRFITALVAAVQQLSPALAEKNMELTEKEGVISLLELRIKELSEHLKEKGGPPSQIPELKEQIASLQASLTDRDNEKSKLRALINGLAQPLFTVNGKNKVITVNKALLAFCGANKTTDITGHKCHEAVHKVKNGKCVWCMFEQVQASGEPVQISATVENKNTKRYLDIIFFPIFDPEKNFVEVAEFITDKTESVELANSLIKFKEKLRDFKKARIDDMNEISEVKKVYQELALEHEHVVDKNGKMIKLIERLVSEDKAKELLSVRTDLMETRNKLMRSSEMVKNYKRQLDEQRNKYSDLNKRTFLQMERLINIMKSKTQTKGEEITTVLNFLTREFDLVKKHFIDTHKKGETKTVAPEEQPKAQTVFKSEEEKLLKKKLSSKEQNKKEKPEEEKVES